MSDYEMHKGSLRPTDLVKDEMVYEYLRNYNGNNKWILNDKKRVLDNKSLDEGAINEYFYDIEEYTEINGKIYKIDENYCDDPDPDIFQMSENPDGSLDYLVRFYNGGCSFGEALDIAYKKIKNRD